MNTQSSERHQRCLSLTFGFVLALAVGASSKSSFPGDAAQTPQAPEGRVLQWIEDSLSTLEMSVPRSYLLDEQARAIDRVELNLRRAREALRGIIQKQEHDRTPRTFTGSYCTGSYKRNDQISANNRQSALDAAVVDAMKQCSGTGYPTCSVTDVRDYADPHPRNAGQSKLCGTAFVKGEYRE